MAPEILTRSAYNESVDCFSFGLLLSEIVFNDGNYVATELAAAARGGSRLGDAAMCSGWRPRFRLPEIEDISVSQQQTRVLENLYFDCVNQDPGSRPHFREVVELLRRASEVSDAPGRDISLTRRRRNDAEICGARSSDADDAERQRALEIKMEKRFQEKLAVRQNQMMAAFSHELRTPLSSILANLEFAREAEDKTPPVCRAHHALPVRSTITIAR